MRVNVFEQYRNGKKLLKPVAYANVDLNIKDGEATIFNDVEMVSYPIKTLSIMVAAHGMMVAGVQEAKFGTWTRQEWWCVPYIKEVSHEK